MKTSSFLTKKCSALAGLKLTLLVLLLYSNSAFAQWTQSVNDLYPNNTTWEVGIGTTAPAYMMDVHGGDLNLDDGIIRIGDNNVVYRDAVNNVAFGVQNDLGSITTGSSNVLVGTSAGDAITTSSHQVFIT